MTPFVIRVLLLTGAYWCGILALAMIVGKIASKVLDVEMEDQSRRREVIEITVGRNGVA